MAGGGEPAAAAAEVWVAAGKEAAVQGAASVREWG